MNGKVLRYAMVGINECNNYCEMLYMRLKWHI